MIKPDFWTARVAVAFTLAMGGAISSAYAVTVAGKDEAAPGIVVKNDAPGWMWYGMVPYENPLLPDGAAHAGGPGAYAMYTFQGSDVEVYGMRSLTIVAGKRTHRIGKVKISIDDTPQATVDLGATTIDYHAKIFSVTGLSGGNHVIQITPVEGWAVVDSLTISMGGNDDKTLSNPINLPADGWYNLQSGDNANFCVDVQHSNAADGTPIWEYTKNGTSAQKWRLTNVNHSGWYLLTPAVNVNSCLDLVTVNAVDGQPVWEHSYNGSNSQLWSFSPVTGGSYRVSSKVDSNMVLEVAGSPADETAIDVHHWNDTPAQHWTLAPVSAP